MAAALLVGLQASLSDLQPALQAELNLIAADHPTLALGLGWAGAGVTLSLAAGNVSIPGQPSRRARADDRFLFGSGTKPFTAVAVLRLMEAGALSLTDLVAAHVDPLLGRANGTSVAALYGAEAAAALTVGHLLHMQSGIPDFDTRSLDATILADGRGEWPPYAILRAAATQAPQLHFAPGLGLGGAAPEPKPEPDPNPNSKPKPKLNRKRDPNPKPNPNQAPQLHFAPGTRTEYSNPT
eukprot:scaffold113191_cov57-Phaeocystis_antarctica.AAC.1